MRQLFCSIYTSSCGGPPVSPVTMTSSSRRTTFVPSVHLSICAARQHTWQMHAYDHYFRVHASYIHTHVCMYVIRLVFARREP